ncbi:outer membrane protein assembly factor BamC [Marinobacter caseinilyticus]|uniref:outer membrane protein assembly factor BamC n=1 Tax=Marinobacter caseinilyticus TaxID=2692195 RepID=UPI00140993E2|nr:outer membrane protein assembly factor BamC [Marinobacter caseinilyticus]
MVVQLKKALSGPVCGLCFAMGVTGCSLMDDRSEEYVNEPAGTPLVLGDGQVMERNTDALPIRSIGASNGGKLNPSDIPRPPDMTSEILEENYIIEEVGNQSWVLVNDVPGRVWPSVAAFFNDRGLGVAEDSTQLGVIQSDVANFSERARTLLKLSDIDSDEPMVFVQARVTPGVRRKTTEIQVRKRLASESPEQLVQWQSEPQDPAIEKSLLADLAGFLKSREDSKSYSRAALAMASAPKVTMVTDAGEPAMEINVSFDRAWAEVRRALEEAKIPVVDLDRSIGQFYVDYRTDEERDLGWFSWFSDEPKPVYTFYVRLETQQERILVTTGKADGYDGSDRSKRLLSELFEYLY